MYCYVKLLLFLLGGAHVYAQGFTVSVTCTIDTMQILVGFDEHFHGRLILRPNNDCFLDGDGRKLLLFSISLQASQTERCSTMLMTSEYVGIMEVQMNRNLIVSSDGQFVVKCPAHVHLLPVGSLESITRFNKRYLFTRGTFAVI